MNAEYLLDAIGLLDDDLIQEAERYSRPKPQRNYGTWLSWAASFLVVIGLGYAVTHLWTTGGGNSMAPASGENYTANGAPAASVPAPDNPGDQAGGNALPSEADPEGSEFPMPPPAGASPPGGNCDMYDYAVEEFGMESGQVPAIMVDGTLYWYAGEGAVRRPDASDIRYSTSYTGGEPAEDGQINFPRENVRYILLEDGGVGVNWNGSYEWLVFRPEYPTIP